MSELILYNKKNQSLGTVPFLQTSLEAVKIRKLGNHELSKALSHWIAETSLALAIKDPISDFNKRDLIQMILREHKALTVDELYYAFKLERYAKFEPLVKGESPITSHFQLFNAEYVSQVLKKYRNWKQKKMMEHNIEVKPEVVTATEEEKRYWINRGVSDCLKYFEEHRSIEDGKVFVYEILYDDGFLSKDVEFKKKMYAEAQEVLRFEYTNKKPSNLKQKKEFKSILLGIEEKRNPKVMAKAKELVLNKFFRELTTGPIRKLENFKGRYKCVERNIEQGI